MFASKHLGRFLATVCAVILSAGSLWAQNITVTGTVMDKNNEPVIGAYVVLMGTTVGTSTDVNGAYSINVPANGSAALVYTARVTEYADPGQSGVITNTAVITGYASPLTVTAAVNAGSGAELEMQKSVSPSAVPANGQLTYTFTILNHGTAEAAATENIVLNDTFDPLLSGLSVTFNGNEWTSPENYAYDETTGVFSTVAGNITVPAATYVRDPATGAWTAVPGTAVLTVSGNI